MSRLSTLARTALELLVALVMVYAIAWYIGPGVDLYLPPRHPCEGGLQKAQMLRTVADIRNTGTAFMTWMAERPVDPTTGSTEPVKVRDIRDFEPVTHEQVFAWLHPTEDFFYMLEVPELDAWDNPYEFYVAGPADAPLSLMMRSAGCDGEFEAELYEVGPFLSTDYGRDLVWTDGYFVRWPG